MKLILYFSLIISVFSACVNKPVKQDEEVAQISLSSIVLEEDEVVMYEDTIWFKDYYAVESGPGTGNYTARVSLYQSKDNSLIVDSEYPVDCDTENQLILYREEVGKLRLMLYDMSKSKFYEVELPEGEEYRGFGSWSCYELDEVTDNSVNITYTCGDGNFITICR